MSGCNAVGSIFLTFFCLPRCRNKNSFGFPETKKKHFRNIIRDAHGPREQNTTGRRRTIKIVYRANDRTAGHTDPLPRRKRERNGEQKTVVKDGNQTPADTWDIFYYYLFFFFVFYVPRSIFRTALGEYRKLLFEDDDNIGSQLDYRRRRQHAACKRASTTPMFSVTPLGW